MKSASSWHRINEADLALCLRLNRLSHIDFLRHVFRVVSRLGDGVFWYVLMILLPLVHGTAAFPTVIRMAVVGVVGLGIYKWLKQKTSRARNRANSSARPARMAMPTNR